MAYITFTDAIGSAQLDNGLRSVAGGVGARFSNWVPASRPIGSSEVSLGTGQTYMFRFRTDYTASFSIEHIPCTSLDVVTRLVVHLLQGGVCAVYTEDTASRSYATCGLAPGSDPQVSIEDRAEMWYRLDLSLINLAASPATMLCTYTT